MDQKTLETLEYPTILSELAAHCHYQPARDKAVNLAPLTEIDQVVLLQEETDEAVQLLNHHPGATIGGARNLEPILDDAVRDLILEPGRIQEVKSTLIAARTFTRFLERQEADYPRLQARVNLLPTISGLVDRIGQVIAEDDSVLDSASPALTQIRQESKVLRNRLKKKIERMLQNPAISKHLQEEIITQRGGRYVLPLRADARSKVPGIVHDQSASGATIFIEPQGMVEGNNRYRQLELEERDEINRILRELTREIAGHETELRRITGVITALDLALARGRYAGDLRAVRPEIKKFPARMKQGHPGVTLQLFQARHPLLEPDSVVPVDIALDDQTYGLIITGPNTGGKTVTLKTAGLLVLMAQTGLHIPAASGSKMSLFQSVYADIGDEQSIEQSLSTFSGHITNIISILEKSDRRSLVILDELGAGTDPQEGAALARGIMTYLLNQGITTLVTTHHPDLKAYAHTTPGVVNASVEFDLESLQPTYHLTIGLPGRSNALAIASRLGLKQEIIQLAKSTLDPADLRADDLLDEIHRQRKLSEEAHQAAERARTEAEELRDQLSDRIHDLEEERLETLEEARREARDQVETLRKELQLLRERIQTDSKPAEEEIEVLKEGLDQVETEISKPVLRPESRPLPLDPRGPLQVGDSVYIRSLGQKGTVQSLEGKDAEVQVGAIRVRTQRSDLSRTKNSESEDPPEPQSTIRKPRDVASPGTELDLRGQRVDEALQNLEYFLDKAFIAGLPYVRIIHGMGRGRLRSAVRKQVKAHPQVSAFERGEEREGGDGVTVVTLQE